MPFFPRGAGADRVYPMDNAQEPEDFAFSSGSEPDVEATMFAAAVAARDMPPLRLPPRAAPPPPPDAMEDEEQPGGSYTPPAGFYEFGCAVGAGGRLEHLVRPVALAQPPSALSALAAAAVLGDQQPGAPISTVAWNPVAPLIGMVPESPPAPKAGDIVTAHEGVQYECPPDSPKHVHHIPYGAYYPDFCPFRFALRFVQ
jgi:hypothetical protein